MLVRIRFGPSAKVERKRGKNKRVALAFGALLTPAALMASVLGIWCIAADLKWTSDFVVSSGFFSHWQVWIASAAGMELFAYILNRYGE